MRSFPPLPSCLPIETKFSSLWGIGEIPLTWCYLSDLWEQGKAQSDFPGLASFLPAAPALLCGKVSTPGRCYLQCLRLLMSGKVSWQGSTQLLLFQPDQPTPLADLLHLYPLTMVDLLSEHNAAHFFSQRPPSIQPTVKVFNEHSCIFSSLNSGIIKNVMFFKKNALKKISDSTFLMLS